MEDRLKVVVYIPAQGSRLAEQIEQGSVVLPLGNPRPDGVRAVTWEARRFDERVKSTFADRAERAYARSRDHRNDLRKLVNAGDIRPIGKLDVGSGEIEIEWETDAAELAAWLGRPSLDPAELTTTRGVVVQMVRESVRTHGDKLKEAEAAAAAAPANQVAAGAGRSSGLHGRRTSEHWHTA